MEKELATSHCTRKAKHEIKAKHEVKLQVKKRKQVKKAIKLEPSSSRVEENGSILALLQVVTP